MTVRHPMPFGKTKPPQKPPAKPKPKPKSAAFRPAEPPPTPAHQSLPDYTVQLDDMTEVLREWVEEFKRLNQILEDYFEQPPEEKEDNDEGTSEEEEEADEDAGTEADDPHPAA